MDAKFARFEEKIKANDDLFANYYDRTIGERADMEQQMRRDFELCATDRSRLVKIVRNEKTKSTGEDYVKLLAMHTEKVKMYNDFKIAAEAQSKQLQAKIAELELKLLNARPSVDKQQNKKRKIMDLDDEIIVPRSNGNVQSPKVVTPKLTFAEGVKKSSDTPIKLMRIVRINDEIEQANDVIFKDDIFKADAIRSMNSRGAKAVFMKFRNDAAVVDFENKLKDKFKNDVDIQKVNTRLR